jgi:glycosyltransferase involved in cell wall biosynthesis
MKVALDVSAVPARPAGAGRYVIEIAHELDAHQLLSRVVARRDDAERWKQITPRSAVSALVPTARASRLTYEAVRLGRGDCVTGADIWHAPHYTMPHRASVPVAVTIHDMTFFTHPQWHEKSKAPFFRRAIRYAAQHASVLISVSEFTARQIREYVSTDVPIVVAPHGVDLERFSPKVTTWPSELPDRHRPYILFVGTVEPRKGLDVLLDAFSSLASEDAEVELWIAGQIGWGTNDIARALESHPAGSRIRTLGYVSDEELVALLVNARAVAYPSRGEGFGLPVLEALACGAPVVTSANTVMAEVAGDAASFCAVGDASALSSALAKILALSDDERHESSVRARQRASEFSWAHSFERHLVAYEVGVGSRREASDQ